MYLRTHIHGNTHTHTPSPPPLTITIKEKEAMKFERGQGRIYGRRWIEEREGRNDVIVT